jgi:endonuclease/exonuclease/phosphatase family metal-dependent hydrolase
MRYGDYPRPVIEDIVRLRRRIGNPADPADPRTVFPPRRTDENLIIGTWNLRRFGGLHRSWEENPGSPKRNLRALAIIAEIVRRFDVIAIQEVLRDTLALRTLLEEFLGLDWGVILSDVTAGASGNSERFAFLYDRRRVTPSGLAGEIVLPPIADGTPAEQFDRTPYVVGFRAAQERFALLTAHIRFADRAEDRLPEIRRVAAFTASEIRDRARTAAAEETNLIVLGDFNIDRRQGNPLFDAFIETGLWVPEAIQTIATNYGREARHYDQIAWFRDAFTLRNDGRAGVIDFVGAVFPELSRRQMTDRVSDHLPLWVEFVTDRSGEEMARALGVDPNMPDPFAAVPDFPR